LRFKEPEMPRPYRTWGYPVVPIVFIISAVALTVNSLVHTPLSSSLGLVVMLVGLIFYARWRKHAPAGQTPQ
ncbi:MAG: hypothetical protein WBE43_08500, partial [Candidatus Acidiferrales bacterium]